MPRFRSSKLPDGSKVRIQFTPEQEAVRDAEEAAWEAGAAERAVVQAEQAFKNDPDQPSVEEKLDALVEGGAKLDALRVKIDAVKAKHGR